MTKTTPQDQIPLCIRLPFLRFAATSRIPFAKSLSPGIPLANAWLPDNYPYTEAESLALLHEFRQLTKADLESMRSISMRENLQGEVNNRDELAALAKFAGADQKAAVPGLTRKLAQKILLWLYVMEEKLEEIAELEAHCNAVESRLPRHFEEFMSDAEVGHEERQQPDFENSVAYIEKNIGIAIPWRVCVANALIFLPEDMPLLIEGEMLAHLMEMLEFGHVSALTTETTAGFDLLEAKAPLWQALGHTRPVSGSGASEYLENFYNAPRIWLGMVK